MNTIVERIRTEKLVVIMRGVPDDKLAALTETLFRAGIRFCEITVDQKSPDGTANACRAISGLRSRFEGRMSVGAGTVLSVKQLEETVGAGAEFIISPNVNARVITRTKELGAVSMPGAMTPTEIAEAYDLGADFVKVFPADQLGAGYVRAVAAPLSHIPMVAVGGIDVSNAAEYLNAGCVALGVGGSIVDRAAVASENWQAIENRAVSLIKVIS